MKRISILLMLMALFAPLAMNAQTTATFNEGTTTSIYLPFYGNYADYGTKGQFIIPATDLANKGITSGSQISKLTFYSNATTSGTFFGSSRIVEVGEVSYSTFSTNANTFVTSGLTTVLSGTPNTLTRNADGTMEVSFSSNYTYNGGNLLISIGGYGSNYISTSWYGVNTNNAGVYGNQSYSNSGSIPTTATMVSFAPKTTITYIPGSTPYLTLNPTSATVLTGFTETLTASYGNVTGTPTITYTSSNTSVATVSGSGTTATVTAVAEGTTTITATLTYEGTDYTATCDITVMDACQPTWTGTDYYITNFTVSKSGTTLLNNSSTGTGGATTNYYPTQSITAEPGDELSCVITMSGSSTYGFAMWVDFDKDGLDSGDLITSTSSYSSSPYTITLDIPANVSSGEYRMRIWGDFLKSSASDPCGAYSKGEAEDYKLIVVAGAYTITCNATTNGTISVNHGSADAGETITVTATPDTNYELTALSYNDGSDHNINFSNNQGSFTMPATDVTVSATFSLIRTLPPYDLTVGTPGGHSVELGWTGVSTNTNHQCYELYFSTDPVMPQTPVQSSFIGNITATSRELTGLTPETTYYAWVRDNCGTDGFSEWVAFTSFTTDVTCPAPTNLSVSNVTNNSAKISFDGADNYNIRYCTMVETTYDFEDGGWSGWTYYDNDGDNKSWVVTDELGEYSSGETYVASHGGDYYLRSTYNASALTENWLISPQINLGGSISFYTERLSGYDDYFKVYVSTTGTSISDFAVEIQGEKEPATDYELVTIDLSNYSGNGYVAIKHYAKENDQAYIFIDDITILEPTSWQYSNSLTLAGLDPETTYQVQVQANCGSEDGMSAWVSTTFTTLDDCAVPYELEATNITVTSAQLGWTGAQNRYNVRYHTPGEKIEEGFEDGTMPEGWNYTGSWSVGAGSYMTLSSAYSGSYNVKCSHGTTGNDYYLIMPAMDLSGASNLTMSLYYANPYYSSNYADDIDCFGVYYRVNEGDWNELFYTTELHNTWTPLSVVLTGLAANYQIGFRMHDNWGGGVAIDNISLTISAGGEWVNKTNVESPLDITNLTPNTSYEWQVQGVNCDGNGTATEWSAMSNFTTLEGYIKDIIGFGSTNNRGGYYLIASPIGTIENPGENVTNLAENTYDFYRFNQAATKEWENWKQYHFDFEKGRGYLYANSDTVALVFTGEAYNGSGEVTLSKTDDTSVEFQGWNLVGNPFAEKAYIADGRGFYTMNGEGTSLLPVTNGSIEAMEGIFVVANYDEETITFTTEQPAKGNGQVAVSVSRSERSVASSSIDRIIVSFDEGRELPKFQLFEDHAKLYIVQDGADYAVVSAEAQGEVPVSFKATENGTYTLSIATENMDMNYLHLVDNMTGNDVDLLQTPSYSFEARTTDYENRFKLVFAGASAGTETFAFFSNGNWIINNEGEATLQVVDVTGRILSSETVNGSFSKAINAASGVYMLRLINGDNVKVQKIVVR